MTTDDADANHEVARTALEQVCSRRDMTLAPKCYAEDFADHVGSLEYHGLVGVERSTALYRALVDDLAFDVVDQVAKGDAQAAGGSGRHCSLRRGCWARCATGAGADGGSGPPLAAFGRSDR